MKSQPQCASNHLEESEEDIARRIFKKPGATGRPSFVANKIQSIADRKRNKWSSVAAALSTTVASKYQNEN